MRSFFSMCSGLVARKVWMRQDFAPFSASMPRWMSLSLARHSPATVRSLITLATALTASKSPLEDAGKPASITSTFMRSSWRAMRSFSSLVIEAPGDCSPSRMVVSKMINLSCVHRPLLGCRDAKSPCRLGRAVKGYCRIGGLFCARGAQQQASQKKRPGWWRSQ